MQKPDIEKIIQCYREYIRFSVENPPTAKEYLKNVELKILDEEFLGDTHLLLRPNELYDPVEAWGLIKSIAMVLS
jgi:hypothetical protein